MTPQEAYKLGFLFRCTLDRCSPEQVKSRVKAAAQQKSADGWTDYFPGLATIGEATKKFFGGVGKSMGEGTGTAAKGLGIYLPIAAAVGVPPAAGALTGHLLARAQDDAYDVDDAKRDEELAEYYRAIEQLQRRRPQPVASPVRRR